MAYDEKYRKRAVEYRGERHTIDETAKTFKIGTTTLKACIRKYNATGEIKDKPPVRKFKKIDPLKLEVYLEIYPDAYLSEMAKHFSCSETAIVKALKRLKITRKKDKTVQRTKP